MIASKFTPYRYGHNIGIIQLESAVPPTTATPIKIYQGPKPTIVFGVSNPKTKIDAPSLVPLNTLDYASCSVYRNYDNSTQLCVDGRQSCYGDEGEALLVATNSTYALVGMASYAVSGAKGAEPSACGEANNVS
ncbi:hypothetical protein GGH92_008570, partial [Coemansia sp. RSA 2673]